MRFFQTNSRALSRTKSFLQPLLSISIVFVAWELVSRSGIVSSALFPGPIKIVVALFGLFQHGLITDVVASTYRAILGLGIGSALGICVGVCTGRNTTIRASISPLLHVFRSLPPVALIPVIITWFGIGEPAKLFAISLAVFFPVWVNAHVGAERVPQEYIRAGQSLGFSRIQELGKVIFPSIMPFAFVGMRVGIGIAFIMVYISELAGASSGLGFQIAISHLNYAMDRMLAVLLVLGIVAALTDWLFEKSVRSLFPWINLS